MSLDPNKTYLTWNGSEFPNSSEAKFKAPAGSSIDWGDGTVETFETASETVNTHTYTDGKDTHTIAISGLTSIGVGAFYNCSSLTNITISNSVTSIGAGAFYDCRSLTNITISNSVTSIGAQAFYGCSSLTSITIPHGVTSIGSSAFSFCSRLQSIVIFAETPPTLGQGVIPSNVQSIYVTQSSKAAYQSATNWNAFADKIVSDNLYLSFIRFNQKNKEYIGEKIKEAEQYADDKSSELNIELDKKLEKPSTAPEVGKVLKVVSVNEDGTFICEWGEGGSNLPSVTDNGKGGTGTPFFDINFGTVGEPLKRFLTESFLIGDHHYGNGFIQNKSGGRLFIPDIGSNNETIPIYSKIRTFFRIDYFDLGAGANYRKSKIRLVPNSVLVITENRDWQAAAIGMVDDNGTLSETDILPHEKTTSIGGKYYDVATTAFIVTGYDNQVYSSSSKYCKVVRITIDGLNTKIKFFSVKEENGVALTVSMKSSGVAHRECIALGALLT